MTPEAKFSHRSCIDNDVQGKQTPGPDPFLYKEMFQLTPGDGDTAAVPVVVEVCGRLVSCCAASRGGLGALLPAVLVATVKHKKCGCLRGEHCGLLHSTSWCRYMRQAQRGTGRQTEQAG